MAAASDGPPAGPLLHDVEVGADKAGVKFAKFAAEAFSALGWSTNRARAAARTGELRLNGGIAGAGTKLKQGDRLTVHQVADVSAEGGGEQAAGAGAAGGEAGGAAEGADSDAGAMMVPDAHAPKLPSQCRKRMNGIACGCPACSNLSAADKKKLRNRKKREAKLRKEAAAAEAAAAAGTTSAAADTTAAPQWGEEVATGEAAALAAAAASTTSAAAAAYAAARVSKDGWLPPNWSSSVDPATNAEYYYNHVTKETTWVRPSAGTGPGRV